MGKSVTYASDGLDRAHEPQSPLLLNTLGTEAEMGRTSNKPGQR
jgi:hypothetical protein